MAPLKVLVVGAGIAGTSLANWLSKSKTEHNITIIERFPAIRDTGLQLDLRGPGIEVLKRMGLESAFRAKSVPEEGFQVVDGADRVWAFFRANRTGQGMQSFTSDFEIMRGDLCRLLHEASLSSRDGDGRPRVRYLFETTITSFTELDNDAGVRVTLESPADGSRTELFDLVVGADGQNSHTRKMLLAQSSQLKSPSDSKDAMHPTGPVIAYFTIPLPPSFSSPSEGKNTNHPLHVAKVYSSTNHRFAMTRFCKPRDNKSPAALQVYLLCVPAPSHAFHAIPKGDVPREKAAMAALFAGAGWKTDEILSAMLDDGPHGARDFYCERLGLVQMERWYSNKGHVVILGDAAYCPTAMTGMGTTSALVGSYVLAGEIERVCRGVAGRNGGVGDGVRADLPRAVRRYDELFRPFIDEVQKGVRENTMLKWWPRSEPGIFVLRLMAGLFVALKIDVVARWVLAEGAVTEWEVPDYEYE